jgi:hypothetical protein
MQTATTNSQQTARNSDTRENFLIWYTQEFGFNPNAATALYDVQMLKDAKGVVHAYVDQKVMS